ncbi:MAG: haloacid dehalogenase-like hydrolase [Anaerolineae bacterium]|nr:haloacid dehalogenase-like hydrolase [Anaerolineae bacterium]NUQ03959.1 haloacid dehalogenase-like hydrolase [Anaerolineae bacterium]
MTDTRWTSFDLIFFDCDSTLSAIEGIDELARFKGKEWRVSVLTQKAMDGDLDLREVYGKRLAAIRPTRGQLKAIEHRYFETMVPDTEAVLAALRFLNKHVFIVSGGLADPVRGFGARLGVPPERIRAVDLEYNELAGEWWRYHEPWTQQGQTYFAYDEGPLTLSSGKPQIVGELAGDLPGRRMMIGDGASDLAVKGVVDLFVGFGGVVARPKVRDASDAFVKVNSLAPILPLAVGMRGAARLLGTPHQPVLERGLGLALDSECLTLRPDLQEAFVTEFAPLISGGRE